MGFPTKNYDRLSNLWRRWGLSQEDVYYAIENGMLRVCVWMPLRFVERCAVRDNKICFESHETKEGFIGVRPEDFRQLCSTGRTKLRTFRSVKIEGHIIRLAYEPPQPSLSVGIHDLVVLKTDRESFESVYELCQQEIANYPTECPSVTEFSASGDYRHIIMDGVPYQLGDVQASIVEQLHEAYDSKKQWVHGKTLLDGAGSKAGRMRDVFKSKPDWNKIIVSDKRGYYRLNMPEPHIITRMKMAQAA